LNSLQINWYSVLGFSQGACRNITHLDNTEVGKYNYKTIKYLRYIGIVFNHHQGKGWKNENKAFGNLEYS
jgi:hypothetical protein